MAEQVVNNIWPFVSAKRDINQSLNKCKEESAHFKSNYIPGVWMHKICIPIAAVCFLLFFFLPQTRTIFGDYQRSTVAILAMMLGFLALVVIVCGIVLRIMYGNPYHAAEARISALEQELTQACARLEDAKYNNCQGLAIAEKLLPANAIDPYHIRMIAGYFETGRAETMTDALPMIEQQLYREETERLHREQIAAIEEITIVRNN